MPGKGLGFYLGADPEFNVEFFGKEQHAKAVLDDFNGRDIVNDGGNLGWDGHASTGEVRPKAATSPEGVVANLKLLFSEYTKKVPLADLTTLSKREPIGGHIHLDLWDDYDNEANVGPFLDTFHAPVLFGENSEAVGRRWNGGYGRFSDIRFDEKSHHTTCEYRVPTAEWITSEKLALSVLAYFAVVWHEYRKTYGQESKTGNGPLYDKLTKKHLLCTASSGRMSLMKDLVRSNLPVKKEEFLKPLKELVEEFELYPQYKEQVDYVFNFEQVLKDKEAIGYSVTKGWGLERAAGEAMKKDILKVSRSNEICANEDMEKSMKYIHVSVGSEFGLASMADVLKKTIAANKWKTPSAVHLYGIRKGIDEYIVSMRRPSDGKLVYSFVRFDDQDPKVNPDLKSLAERMVRSTDGELSIGVPYGDRMKDRVKRLIEVVYEAECGAIRTELMGA